MKTQLKTWLAIGAAVLTAAAVVTGCGGGGGYASNSGYGGIPVTYTAAAGAGELVTYTIDTTAKTYSYTITDSQYGLTGRTGSGTLTQLGTYRYALSGIPQSILVVLPNGVLLGAVRDVFVPGGAPLTVPVLGLSNPVTSLSALNGTYNYVTRGCTAIGSCSATGGTLQINGGNWNFCSGGNLLGCAFSGSGTLTSVGNGKFDASVGGTLIGTLFATVSGGQNVVIIDLKDPRLGGLGKGIVVASSQTSVIGNTSLNGSWAGITSTGNWGTFNVSGTTIQSTSVNGIQVTPASNPPITAAPDSPWTGLITTPGPNISMLAGYGVYITGGPNGYLEMGVKYN